MFLLSIAGSLLCVSCEGYCCCPRFNSECLRARLCWQSESCWPPQLRSSRVDEAYDLIPALLQAVMRIYSEQLRALQQNVGEGSVPENINDIYGHILAHEGSVPRYSLAVLGKSLEDSGDDGDDIDSTRQLPQHVLDASICGKAGERISHLRYLHSPGSQVCCRY
jgi:hypothetical protein